MTTTTEYLKYMEEHKEELKDSITAASVQFVECQELPPNIKIIEIGGIKIGVLIEKIEQNT